nr:laminin subunit beta-3 isoform X1 [Zootoca vivipara]XP_034978545.1 laminin subunit beta-3 isoform X1 [Zootoca vivipara]XP_034978546.1 laminin subunit beta-3 isoform X1 [Zootoca vivipara]
MPGVGFILTPASKRRKNPRGEAGEFLALRNLSIMWIFLFFLASPHLLAAQSTCSHGACYPPVRDLLVGRIHHLKASSTCGLVQPETYCTPYGEWQMKCCRCDSRTPRAFNSHRVENVLSSAGNTRWWQSKNDVNPVFLQLDLDKKFQLDSILMDFRSPLPVGMVIEHSTDFGKSWKTYQYLSTDCAASFPRITRGLPQTWQDVRCQDIQTQPQNGGKVEFNPIGLASGMRTSQSQKIINLGQFTNLRINFTHLSRPVHQGYRTPSAFYALNEMQVKGSCFCHGHADRCAAPDAASAGHNVMVNGQCVCQHNTAGTNCERCAAFYNDHPWRAAEDGNPNECHRCNCNGHSNKCYFDPAVYQASGGVSGGVCEDCQHNTAGRNCEHCKTMFFRNKRFELDHPEACLPCECDPDGTVPNSSCDPQTGRCVCKDNVQGGRCHLCKPGFTQLTNSNPQGCRDCACSVLGSRRNVPCDDETGRCSCLPNVVGDKCDECAANHWKIASGQGCQACNCDPQHSRSPQCNQFTGQCPCREGYGGLTCSASEVRVCPDQSYGDVRTGCRACDCNFQGTEEMGCDKLTGRCLCRPGFTGGRCDQCQRGYCGNYDHCEACNPCFQVYDDELNRFGLRQATLKNSTQRLQVGTMSSSFSTRLLEAEGEAQLIQGILGNPLLAEQGLDQVANAIAAIRQTIEGLRHEIPFRDEASSLSIDMDNLDRSLILIITEYQNKKAQFEASRSTDVSGAFKTLSSAHQTSSNASLRIAGSSRLLAQSAENRQSAEVLESDLASHGSGLEALQDEMAFSPNLTPAINKICSGIRSEICSPGECPGEVCPQQNTTGCGPGWRCTGVFSLSGSSIQTATKTSQDIHNLNIRFQETTKMIRAAEIAVGQIQTNARSLGDQMTSTRAQIEGDIHCTQQFIYQVRNFLSDPDTDAATIQQVSDYVLSLRLPADTATVLRKMNEIQSLAAKLQCPETFISQTAGDIAKARQLQQQAEEARNRANAIGANVEDVVENLKQANTALQEAEDTIRGSGYSLRLIQDRLNEIQAVLNPAEKHVQDITGQLGGFTGRLAQLQLNAKQNLLLAADAQQKAGEASEQARSTQQRFEQVRQKYAELKRRMGQGSNLGEQGTRIQNAHKEASTLFTEALSMVAKMGAIETELQDSNSAFLLESAKLAGLEKKVEAIRDHISRRVEYYATCTD